MASDQFGVVAISLTEHDRVGRNDGSQCSRGVGPIEGGCVVGGDPCPVDDGPQAVPIDAASYQCVGCFPPLDEGWTQPGHGAGTIEYLEREPIGLCLDGEVLCCQEVGLPAIPLSGRGLCRLTVGAGFGQGRGGAVAFRCDDPGQVVKHGPVAVEVAGIEGFYSERRVRQGRWVDILGG